MSYLATVRAGIAFLLDGIDGLTVLGAATKKSPAPLPAAVVDLSCPEGLHESFGTNGATDLDLSILLVASRAQGDHRAVAELDLLVAEQVPDALYSDQTVDGCFWAGGVTAAAQSVKLHGWEPYGPVEWAGLDLLGCRMNGVVRTRRGD